MNGLGRRGGPHSSRPPEGPLVVEGIAGSTGLAIGPAAVLDTGRTVVRRSIKRHLADEEIARFERAVEVAANELREVAARISSVASRAEASILEAYVLMVEDETLRNEVSRIISFDGQCAEWALESAVRDMCAQLSAADDPYIAERSHDVEFVMDRILGALAGHGRSALIPDAESPRIIVARDLSPAETAGLRKEHVLALVTEMGTRTSHTAIIARALEIPAVVGVRDILTRVGNGDILIVDGLRGTVTLAPSDGMVADAGTRVRRHAEKALAQRELRDRPALTRCGVELALRANIELPAEAEIAMGEGALGIGLYRTEFLYINRLEPPSEDEQYETYEQVLKTTSPLPVTLRTFDIGGDKFSSVLRAPPEMNPALGLRAVRLGLERPELFLDQLRAMVRASAHGDLRIMVPMIAALRELRAVRALLTRAIEQVDERGQARAPVIQLGMMVEVPSAALMAREFAAEAEFLSIGTNDLVQYTLAVDRTSRELTHLARFFDPSILRLIDGVIQAGQFHRRPVTVCGAMASDPMAAVLLLGMGLRELSMEASAIPDVKEALSRVTLAEAVDAARACFQQTTAEGVEAILVERFGPRIADLLDD